MAAVHVAALLSHPAVRSAIERALAARGTHGDTLLIHANPREAAMLRFMGGVGTVNPRTGLRQFYNPDAGHADPTGSAGVDSTGGSSNSGLGQGVGGQGGSGGSGLGAGGGHSGQNYYSQTMYNTGTNTPGGGGAAYVAPAAINNMPAAAPVTLDPMMSSTATTDLTGGRFGALPSWAMTPYQIGMAPSSYPTPGVNAALGAPGGGGGIGTGGTANGIGGASGTGGTGGSGITPIGSSGLVSTPSGLGVQLPSGAVALLNYNGAPAIGGGSGNTPTLPNGQTLSQYLTSLKLGLTPNMPGAPTATGVTPSTAQPVANQLATTAQAAPAAAPQLHPAVQQAITQGILGGTVAAQPSLQTAAQKAALQRLLAAGPVTSGRR